MVYLRKENIMIKKCIGCGSILQNQDSNQIGYVSDLEKDLCERCFKIRHYNQYQTVEKTNQDYIPILKQIASTNDLVLLVVDLWNISPKLNEILSYFHDHVLLVMTKRDLLPKGLYEQRLLDYMNDDSFVDKIMISSQKNYQFDLLLEKIRQYQTSQHVYIVGLTNAGKSTMLNQMIKNYTNLNTMITTSMQPSTTVGMIEIPIDESLILIDTPGILDEGNFLNVVSPKMMKKMIPKKEIKPISYQIKGTQYLWIDQICSFIIKDNDVIFYIANTLKIERFYKEKDHTQFVSHHFMVEGVQDIVLPGLGFIKVMRPGDVTVFVPKEVNVFIRDSFI